jgi:Zn-dependent metalloprotease
MPVHRHHGPSHVCCTIAPRYVLERVADSGDAEQRAAAERTIASLPIMQARRLLVAQLIADPTVDVKALGVVAPGTGSANRVYDAHGLSFTSFELPGEPVRGPGDPESADVAVNDAFDGVKATLDFYDQVFARRGIDDAGMDVISSVHVTDQLGDAWENAAWNSSQMVYGDAGRVFRAGSLTTALDVIGHELTHGVTEFSAALVYRSQSGALNESMSDVFGSMIKQHALGQTSDQADWLIGAGLLVDAEAIALRSMKDPGTAFPDDPQPATMSAYAVLPETEAGDRGGVHINSSIPNRAFALAAIALGGHAWDQAGPIWYKTLTERLRPNSQFAEAAQATVEVAEELFPGGEVRAAVENAWREVEVLQ